MLFSNFPRFQSRAKSVLITSYLSAIRDWGQIVANVRLEQKSSWPKWLREYAQPPAGLDKTPVASKTAGSKEREEAQADKPKVPTYLAIGVDDISQIRLPTLASNVRYTLIKDEVSWAVVRFRVGDDDTLRPEKSRAVSSWFKVRDAERQIHVDRSTASKDGSQPLPSPPWDLDARTEGGENVWAIKVIPEDSVTPFVKDGSVSLQRTGDQLRVVGTLPAIDNVADVLLVLMLPPAVSAVGGSSTLELAPDRTGNLAEAINQIKSKSESLRREAEECRRQAKETVPLKIKLEAFARKAHGFAKNPKGEGLKGWQEGPRQNAQQFVGDFAMALADEWNAKKEKRFDNLRTLGNGVGKKMDAGEAFEANKALRDEIVSLRKSVKDGEKPIRLGELKSLSDELAQMLDPNYSESRKRELTENAVQKDKEADAIRNHPLLRDVSTVPQGDYRLILRSASKREALIAVIKVSNP